MRIPRIKTIQDDSVEEEIFSIKDYEKPEFPYLKTSSVNDKLIKRIERVVRGSIEYKEYIQYLKDELDLNYCSYFQSIDWNDVTIDMHHSLFTLYDIVSIVINKQLINNSNVTVWDIAEEVMLLHYDNKVALTPLSRTVHDLVHTNDVFIPIQMQYGDWYSFYKEYKKYMTEDQIKTINEIVKASNDYEKEIKLPDILRRKYIYIECDGLTLPKKIKVKEEDIC